MEVGGAAVVEWGQRKAEFLPDIRKFQVPFNLLGWGCVGRTSVLQLWRPMMIRQQKVAPLLQVHFLYIVYY